VEVTHESPEQSDLNRYRRRRGVDWKWSRPWS
jgi:hypothetical protein